MDEYRRTHRTHQQIVNKQKPTKAQQKIASKICYAIIQIVKQQKKKIFHEQKKNSVHSSFLFYSVYLHGDCSLKIFYIVIFDFFLQKEKPMCIIIVSS